MIASSTYWLLENGVSLATLEWGLATIPPVVCLLAVHILFRNCVTILWFSVKLVLAGLVYMHVQDLMDSSLRPLISLRSIISGEQSHVMQMSHGFEMARMHAVVLSRSAVSVFCPTCLPPLEAPTPPEEERHKTIRWVDWMSDNLS